MHNSWLIDIIEANRGGESKGIYAVESQNLTVQEAYLRQALADSSPALFEICADMMDSHGQSGKMLPVEFIANVKRNAQKTGFPRDRLFFGINNINPSLWKDESVESALKNTCAFISDLVSLGFNILGIHAGIPLTQGRLSGPAALSRNNYRARSNTLSGGGGCCGFPAG